MDCYKVHYLYSSVVTYIVVPAHIVAGNNYVSTRGTYCRPKVLYCRRDEIFSLHILWSATVRA